MWELLKVSGHLGSLKDIQREYEKLPSLVLKPLCLLREHAKMTDKKKRSGFLFQSVLKVWENSEIQDFYKIYEKFQEKESIAEYKKKLS
ncbi:Uncharacterised protein [Fusobacterium necrophorum subsp. necrophorum]|nr:Uncharacterised protein [Fusobacterium necrophorum subsp. necrophorum]